jgi:hypothetical protein
MRERIGSCKQVIRWVLVSALLWAPTASGAVTWVGMTKERSICPGMGSGITYHDFTLDMEPGSGFGTLTVVGGPPLPVATDWTVDGKYTYFAASIQDAEFGPVVFYGWTLGSKMRGWIVVHDYSTGCMVMGRLKGRP